MKENLQAEQPVTTGQIKKIHVLLQQKGIMDEKEVLVYGVSGNRTGSTKELTMREAVYLINYLLEEDAEMRVKKNAAFRDIYYLAWSMDMIYGKTNDDYQMNKAKLNMFCRRRGTVKKNMDEMDLPELQKTKRQFEAMYKKYKSKNKKVNE